MKELESVIITNPTAEDFTWRWNGEPYTIKAQETKGFAMPVSFHLAKHLSTKMIELEFPKKKKFANDSERERESVKFSQLTLFDNPKRRIALFKILGDTKLVMEVIMAYPFKGFMEGDLIGTMEDYKTFVREKGGTFETEPKGKPTLESLMDKIELLEKRLADKEPTKDEPNVKTD